MTALLVAAVLVALAIYGSSSRTEDVGSATASDAAPAPMADEPAIASVPVESPTPLPAPTKSTAGTWIVVGCIVGGTIYGFSGDDATVRQKHDSQPVPVARSAEPRAHESATSRPRRAPTRPPRQPRLDPAPQIGISSAPSELPARGSIFPRPASAKEGPRSAILDQLENAPPSSLLDQLGTAPPYGGDDLAPPRSRPRGSKSRAPSISTLPSLHNGPVEVKPYVRNDGTRVRGHTRRAPRR